MILICTRLCSGPQFNIKMSSYRYRKSHCGDKTILRPSYLHNGISYIGKTSSLYWIRALMCSALFCWCCVPILIARFVGATWGLHGADRSHVGPMLAPWALISGQWLDYCRPISSHIPQCCFIGFGAIVWLAHCQWINPKGFDNNLS